MENQNQKPNDEDKPIKLAPPKPTTRQKTWGILTCWRPLIKYEGGKFALMILKLSEAVLNLERIQKKLVKNNNIIMQQIQGHQMAAMAKKEEEVKRVKEDISCQ